MCATIEVPGAAMLAARHTSSFPKYQYMSVGSFRVIPPRPEVVKQMSACFLSFSIFRATTFPYFVSVITLQQYVGSTVET